MTCSATPEPVRYKHRCNLSQGVAYSSTIFPLSLYDNTGKEDSYERIRVQAAVNLIPPGATAPHQNGFFHDWRQPIGFRDDANAVLLLFGKHAD